MIVNDTSRVIRIRTVGDNTTWSITMTLVAKARASANKTFIVHASPTIVTYNPQNIFIVMATG